MASSVGDNPWMMLDTLHLVPQVSLHKVNKHTLKQLVAAENNVTNTDLPCYLMKLSSLKR